MVDNNLACIDHVSDSVNRENKDKKSKVIQNNNTLNPYEGGIVSDKKLQSHEDIKQVADRVNESGDIADQVENDQIKKMENPAESEAQNVAIAEEIVEDVVADFVTNKNILVDAARNVCVKLSDRIN